MGRWPTTYSCKLMEAGIISYEDSGAGIAYLTKQTIDKIAPSIIGKPVVVRHQKVTPENHDKVAVGYVTGVHFEPADAWFYVDFMIISDEVEPIDRDGCVVFKAPDGEILDGISGAYDVINTADGGVWHDIKFDAEILDGSFTHLALVVNPRYEETNKIREASFMLINGKVANQIDNAESPEYKEQFAKEKKEHPEMTDAEIKKIVLDHARAKNKEAASDENMNSKEESPMKNLFKIFRKVTNGKDEAEEVMNAAVDIDGQEIPVKELIDTYKAEEVEKAEKAKLDAENAKKNEKRMAKDEDEIDVDGKKVKVEDLKNCFKAKMAKKNEKEMEEADKKAKAKSEEEAKNAKEAEEKEAKEKAEKEAANAKTAEEKAAEEKKNAEEAKAEEEKKAKEDKENSKKTGDEFFKKIENAGTTVASDDAPVAPLGRSERANIGRQRYGSKNK